MDRLELLLIPVPMLDAIVGNGAGTAGICGDEWTGAGTGRAATAATAVGTSGCALG